jgi:hypothetical protein
MNNTNSTPRVGRSSPFKDVALVKSCKRWLAYINRYWKRKPIGYFPDEIEAAKDYNTAAINLSGEFSRLNHV